MTDPVPSTGLQLLSRVTKDAHLEVSLIDQPVPAPRDDQVVVKVLATPINPSDLGLLFGAADMSSAVATTRDGHPLVTADVPPGGMRAMAGRLDEAMPVGNEGSGIVVAAGASPAAQALLGKTVAMLGGAMYAQYRVLRVAECMVLPDGTAPADGASCFVNPLTSLAMTEVMRREGHTALVHTAAASNLGQMLVKICLKDGIPLVNVVRSPAQAELLRGIGAVHVADSSQPDFLETLTAMMVETGATLAFDAIGGGKLAGQLLSCMEAAAVKRMTTYSRYGSDTFKQVYIYGGLDVAPTTLNRNSFGFSWSLSGFLLTPFLVKIGAEAVQALKDRVVAELTTTFASHYTHEISLVEALQPDVIEAYNRRATGTKYLICPHKAG
ncbi:NADH oxidase [Sphingomonas sp. AAP5]|uniref:NADH oxidoreductase n=1 Tax=Sphingomonas glacialis TaxID=658225 RepID=A0ABQ3LL77_9SPHN|nr:MULTISPECIES: zinc-binding dehydrogenase [Sphingomonas]MDY7524387.1 zinc-binding dehydrogenase [Sphingomonas sp. 10B4]MEB0283545.1 zinc-binding dehydrogenase [Sphingomonas sp. 10B4]QBM77222.1 NADH oxidase [Sphingomonas sp. AAP5]GHH17587.1 NADH oxidoreductase [Sphingomonas glacialis]